MDDSFASELRANKVPEHVIDAARALIPNGSNLWMVELKGTDKLLPYQRYEVLEVKESELLVSLLGTAIEGEPFTVPRLLRQDTGTAFEAKVGSRWWIPVFCIAAIFYYQRGIYSAEQVIEIVSDIPLILDDFEETRLKALRVLANE